MRCEIVERADSSTFLLPFQGSIVCRACGADNVCRPFRAQFICRACGAPVAELLSRVFPLRSTATRCRTFASACGSLRLNLQDSGNCHVSLS